MIFQTTTKNLASSCDRAGFGFRTIAQYALPSPRFVCLISSSSYYPSSSTRYRPSKQLLAAAVTGRAPASGQSHSLLCHLFVSFSSFHSNSTQYSATISQAAVMGRASASGQSRSLLSFRSIQNSKQLCLGQQEEGRKEAVLAKRVSAGESLKETAREDATWSHYRGDLKTACFGGKSQSSLGSLTDESIPPPNLTSHYSAPATGQASASAQSTHPLSHSFTSLHHLITFHDEIPLFLSCQVWSSGAPCEVQSQRFFHVYYYLSPISAVCIDEML